MLRFKGIWFKASQSYTEQIWCKSIFSSNMSPGIKLGISRTEGRAPTNCAILAAIKPHGHIKGIINNLWKVELLSNFLQQRFLTSNNISGLIRKWQHAKHCYSTCFAPMSQNKLHIFVACFSVP